MHDFDIESLRFSCTACVRGYYVRYAIEKEHLVLSQVAIGMEYRYDGLLEPVTFTGVLLLGAERIDRVWLRSFCPPNCNYLKVRQVRFDEGRVIGDMDRSQEVEDLRSEFSDDSELSLAE